MYSAPGHPFWLELVKRIAGLPPDAEGRAEDTTGPRMLMHVLADHWPAYSRDVFIEPPVRCAHSLTLTHIHTQ